MRRAHLRAAIAVLVVCLVGSPVAAQRGRSATDDQIVSGAVLVAAGDHVEIYGHGVTVDPAFLRMAEAAYGRLEALTGRPLDRATLGPRIRIYVSDGISVSHVWRGYEHPTDPKGLVFLSHRAYQGALRRTNATYVHEMAHLFTWRYRSHTLREGLADYLALEILPGAGVGPNPDGYDRSAGVPTDVLQYLGTTRPAPPGLASDMSYRRAYYFASYRFVRYLIELHGLEVFLKLYESDSPETEMTTLYGAGREELIRRAGL